MDILAHILFLMAKHRFLFVPLSFAIAFGLGWPLSRLIGRHARVFALVVIAAFLNIFFGPDLSAYVLYKRGETGSAQITGTFATSTQYNNHDVVGYNILIKTAEGKIVETSFEDDDFNLYPAPDGFVYPQPGDQFNVRYLRTFPQDFVIVADDDSPWARRRKCDGLRETLLEAKRKFDFDNAGSTYRSLYIAAIRTFVDDKCYDDDDDRRAYEQDIENAQAGVK
ncbi:hypothetical protein [Methylocapsa sp. S129]|uniref:hypothetical protein n=1 Tax=Methylocapsa sp. S129 TaxID=1641869 RepID=UPI00131AF275|nr:hypothetical protein [Methylocapsa sp. S129]